MADSLDQVVSPANELVSAIMGDDVPDNLRAMRPVERTGRFVGVCLIHPPIAGLMSVVPEPVIQQVVMPALSQAKKVATGLDVRYTLDKRDTPDGRLMLFIHEAVEGE